MRSCSRSAAGVCAIVRLGLAGLDAEPGDAVWNRLMSPQADSARPAHSSEAAAQRRRLILYSRRPAPSATSATRLRWSGELIPAEQLNLPHPEHLDSRPAPRLDKAADTNPPILEGLKDDSG